MALTFTQKIRGKMGSKEFRVYEVTQDASATTIEASALDLNYIDYAIPSLKDVLTAVAAHVYFSVTAGKYVTLAAAGTASETVIVQAWGW